MSEYKGSQDLQGQYAPWPFNLALTNWSTPDGCPPDGSGKPPIGYTPNAGDPPQGYYDAEGRKIPSASDFAAWGIPNPYEMQLAQAAAERAKLVQPTVEAFLSLTRRRR